MPVHTIMMLEFGANVSMLPSIVVSKVEYVEKV